MLPSSCDTLHAAHERVSEAVLKSRQAHTPVLGIYAGDGSPITHLDQVSDGDMLLVRTDGTADAWDDRLFVVLLFGMCPVLRAPVSTVPPLARFARVCGACDCVFATSARRGYTCWHPSSLSLCILSLCHLRLSLSRSFSPSFSLLLPLPRSRFLCKTQNAKRGGLTRVCVFKRGC